MNRDTWLCNHGCTFKTKQKKPSIKCTYTQTWLTHSQLYNTVNTNYLFTSGPGTAGWRFTVTRVDFYTHVYAHMLRKSFQNFSYLTSCLTKPEETPEALSVHFWTIPRKSSHRNRLFLWGFTCHAPVFPPNSPAHMNVKLIYAASDTACSLVCQTCLSLIRVNAGQSGWWRFVLLCTGVYARWLGLPHREINGGQLSGNSRMVSREDKLSLGLSRKRINTMCRTKFKQSQERMFIELRSIFLSDQKTPADKRKSAAGARWFVPVLHLESQQLVNWLIVWS